MAFGFLLLLSFLISSSALAQPSSSPPPQDPLMTLMLSQPKIDVDSPVQATAMFDPPVVRPGQRSIYRIRLNALEESVERPEKLPAPPQLEVRAGGHGQILTFAGPTLQPLTAFNYHVQAAEPGQFTIPEFTVTAYGKKIKVPVARLGVSADAPEASASVLSLELPTTNLYAGQSIRISIVLPGVFGVVPQGRNPVQVLGEGFMIDQAAIRQRAEVRARAQGGVLGSVVFETSLTPLTAGRLSAIAQAFVVGGPPTATVQPGIGPGGRIIISGAGAGSVFGAEYTLLDSLPVEFRVRPLPRSGELPGFTGAVGSFAVEPPSLSTNRLRVGDPVKLTVRITADPNSNLARLVPPPPPQARDWQVLAPTMEGALPQIIQGQGFNTFTYTLIPLSEQARETPALPFSCFDPGRKTYKDLTIPPIPVTVKAAAQPVDLAALRQANAAEAHVEKEPVMSDLAFSPGLAAASLVPVQRQAWFPLIQLAPAAAFLALWNWDRRRRYLEAHPDVVLRRRARRALRRQRRLLERAAQAGDSRRFAAAAVEAIRVACAPHFPAIPHALVGADVLSVLPEGERTGVGGQTVRRLFGATDAAQFALAADDSEELLQLRSQLEGVLAQLEERL